MKQIFEIIAWILFAILWIWFWFFIVSDISIYSQVQENTDQWWYMKIGIVDTSIHDEFYDSILKGIEDEEDTTD